MKISRSIASKTSFETRRTSFRSFAILSFICTLLTPPLVANAQEIVVGRDAEGRVSVKATRYDGRVVIDGNFDESIYSEIAPITDFIQQLPIEGAPASERTEAWVFYDDDNIYISARNYESETKEMEGGASISTGTLCGIHALVGSMAGGQWRCGFRFAHFDTSRAKSKLGAFSSDV